MSDNIANYENGKSENLMPLTFQKWYENMLKKGYEYEVSQMIATLVAYEYGEVTISDGVKEKLMELDVVDKDGKIKIKDVQNNLRWIEIAIKLQTHYINNNYKF